MISLLNILNLISVLLSLIFQVFLVRLWGAVLQTDVYYLSIGIIQFISGTFVGFLMDLYIPIYNEIKVRNEEESKKFTGIIFIIMLIVGILLSAIVFLLAPYIIKLFASGFTPEKVIFSARLLRILSISIIFTSLTTVINATLQANLFMLITYVTTLIMPFFNIIALLFFAKAYGIQVIIYTIVLAAIVNFLIVLSFFYKKIGIRISNPFTQDSIPYLLKQNIPLRVGTLIYSFKGPLTMNILSYFPTGYITLFTYADRVLNILFRITNSPISQILYVKASNLLSRNKVRELKSILLSTIRSNTILFIAIIIPIMIFFKKMFGFLFTSKVTLTQISIMYYFFLALVPFYLVLSFEIPFTNITVAMKKGVKVLQINASFILLYGLFLLSGIKFIGVYIIPIALFFAQLYNTITYVKFVNKNLHIVDLDIFKIILKSSIFVALLILLNAIFRNHFLYTLYFNILLVFLWSLFARKEITIVFQFITTKGEVK